VPNHPGVHCGGCKEGKGGAGLKIMLVVGIVGALVVYRYRHPIIEFFQIAALTVLSLAGAAAAIYVAIVAMRVYQARPHRISYRRMRKTQLPVPVLKVIRLGTEGTPQHKELRERINDDLARQAAHLTDEQVYTSR
jgi:hypothetical protein